MQDREKSKALAEKIKENNAVEVESMVNQNFILDDRDFWLAFYHPESMTREMLGILCKYHPFSKDLNNTSFRYHLYIRGCAHISPDEFINATDLNKGACAGFISAMEYFACQGNLSAVSKLLDQNIQERPIFIAHGIHESYFTGLNLCDIEEFKIRIARNINRELIEKCEIIELFLKNPTEDIFKQIEKLANYYNNGLYYATSMLPFFSWSAAYNNASLFDNASFKHLVEIFPDAFRDSVKIAAVFNAREFIKKAIPLLDLDSIRNLLTIAAAAHHHPLIEDITNVLLELGLSLKDLSYKNIQRAVESAYGQTEEEEPLFWAIRNDNYDATHHFLKNGLDPTVVFSDGDSMLDLAVRVGNVAIVNDLIAHGANVNHKDCLQQTPLHSACQNEQWDIAVLLIKNNADSTTLDHANKNPLDYIHDENIKKRLLEAVNDKKTAFSQNPFITFSSSPKTLQKSEKSPESRFKNDIR